MRCFRLLRHPAHQPALRALSAESAQQGAPAQSCPSAPRLWAPCLQLPQAGHSTGRCGAWTGQQNVRGSGSSNGLHRCRRRITR